MPQPWKGDGVGYGPDTVLERPELAMQIANVSANWVLIESDIAWLYALLLGMDLPKDKGDLPRSHPIAFQIFEALNSVQARLDLLGRLCKTRAAKTESEYFETTLKGEISKCFTLRSVVAHGLWGTDSKYPDALILVGGSSGSFVYKKHDFETISKRILELDKTLKRFIVLIWSQIQ